PTAPDEICAVVTRALGRNPDERFVSAAAMGEAIESFAHALGLRLSADVLAPLVCEVATAPAPMPAVAASARPEPPRVVPAADSSPPAIAAFRTRPVEQRKSRRGPALAMA